MVQIWSKYHRYFLDICLVGTNISIYGSISWSISMVPPSDVGHFGYQTSHATWEVPDVFSCRFGTSQVWRLHCLHVHAFSKLTSSKDNKYASQLQVASGSCSCTVSMFNSPSIPWICPGTCGLLTAKQKILNLCVCVSVWLCSTFLSESWFANLKKIRFFGFLYPPVNWHSYGKWPLQQGKSSTSATHSIAMSLLKGIYHIK